MKVLNWLKSSQKAIVAVVGVVATVVVTAVADGHIDPVEWWGIAVAGVTGVATYWQSNRIQTYAKSVVTFLGGISSVVITALADGHLTGAEWLGLLVAAASALGVYRTSNAGRPAVRPVDAGGPSGSRIG